MGLHQQQRQACNARRRVRLGFGQAALARWYGTALTTGATVDDVKAWPDQIRACQTDLP